MAKTGLSLKESEVHFSRFGFGLAEAEFQIQLFGLAEAKSQHQTSASASFPLNFYFFGL